VAVRREMEALFRTEFAAKADGGNGVKTNRVNNGVNGTHCV
jgi:hypothetical protein